MSEVDARRRILSHQAYIAALSILKHKKSEVSIQAARWREIYNRQHTAAGFRRQVANYDSAIRDITIVLVTGAAALLGAGAVARLMANPARWAFIGTSGASTVPLPNGGVLTVVGTTAASTARRVLVGQILQTILFRIPTSALLTFTVGSTALRRFMELVLGKLGEVKYSEAEFEEMRSALENQGVGAARYHEVLRNPEARRAELMQALSDAVRDMVAQHLGERIMSVPPPVNALLLMSNQEIADWYRQLKTDVDRYIDRQYGSWDPEDRDILRNELYWEFWTNIQRTLNDLDFIWHSNTNVLLKAIKTEEYEIAVTRYQSKTTRR